MTSVAVVTVTHRRTGHLLNQRASLLRSTVPVQHVVVAIADDLDGLDASPGPPVTVLDLPTHDLGLPLAAARNHGARHAWAAGSDLVVFLDVDCMASPGLVGAYVDAAADDRLLCGPVAYLPPAGPEGYDLDALDSLADPHPARPAPAVGEVVVDAHGHDLFWSLSFAATPTTWDAIGGFDETYVGYGAEDTDLGRRARRAGLPMAWVGGARAHHQHHPVSSPPVEHLDDIVRNAGLFHERWGEWPMGGWLDAFERLGLIRRDASGRPVRT